MARTASPAMETVTPVHNRFTLTTKIVVDVKLEEISPGKSAVNFYLGDLKFNNKAHPIPDYSLYPKQSDYEIALEGWAHGIRANPTGE